ncbi:MAG: DHHA1 domain-containing protein [Candidatus Asgardarchaeia archaeon]
MSNFSTFISKAKEVAEIILEKISKGERLIVISHYDADGITAAGIITEAIRRADGVFHTRIYRQLEEVFLPEIKEFEEGTIILTDFGSGQLSLIKDYLKGKNVIILDHHTPEQVELKDITLYHLNPHIYGIDGSKEVSSAGIAYLVAKHMGKNEDLSAYAIVGALGDNQDKGKQNSLVGINKEIILEDAINSDVIEEKKGFMFFGRETRPLYVAIEYSTDPFIPELSGKRENVLQFLKRIGIPLKDENGKWRTLSSLTTDEKRRLASELIAHMYKYGATSDEMKAIIGYLYILKKEQKGTPLRDAREFSTLLNSCGRLGSPELGVIIVMGDRSYYYREALKLYNQYRQEISKSLNWLYEHREQVIKELDYVQAFHGRKEIKDTVIGTVASIALYSRILKNDKPIIAFAYSEDGTVKVSARTTTTMVKLGVNLAKALKNAAAKINSPYVAGGHDIAAGARIPSGKEDDFLIAVDEEIKNQLAIIKKGG